MVVGEEKKASIYDIFIIGLGSPEEPGEAGKMGHKAIYHIGRAFLVREVGSNDAVFTVPAYLHLQHSLLLRPPPFAAHAQTALD